jgi:hypothetical protein
MSINEKFALLFRLCIEIAKSNISISSPERRWRETEYEDEESFSNSSSFWHAVFTIKTEILLWILGKYFGF